MITYLECGCFPSYIGFTADKKEFEKELKRLKLPPQAYLASDHAKATLHEIEGDNGLVCIMTIDPVAMRKHAPVEIAGLCFHEAVHAWQFTREYIGEKTPGHETEAYFIQNVGQFFLQNALKAKARK